MWVKLTTALKNKFRQKTPEPEITPEPEARNQSKPEVRHQQLLNRLTSARISTFFTKLVRFKNKKKT